jgi:catechol 2,3-dioxygenase-like lactoylglutathione lyase family enzyme
MRLDHVGILVDDLEGACAFASAVLGLGEPTRVRDDELGLSAAFFQLERGRLEFLRFDEPGDRLAAGERVRLDHVAVEVADHDAEAARLRGHGGRFQGPVRPDEVPAPVEVNGRRHLWTIPSTAGGFRLQLSEPAR